MGPATVFIREQGWKLRELTQLQGGEALPKENRLQL